MRIRKKWLRDFASIVFSLYYLVAAEQADEKVRKVRAMLTLDHLRVSWNKSTTPYLSLFTNLVRPRLMRYPPRAIRIPRPPHSDYKEPVSGWLYFNGPISALKNHTRVVLDIPGGGFVAMDPRTNDDKLFAWAGKTGLPVLSLDYKKAPEYPYPYSLNECYDVYSTIIASRGRCVGLAGDVVPKVVLCGDSAGGNIATSCTLMIIESGSTGTRKSQGQVNLPIPDGLVLMYPGLDMNIGNWMSDEQMSLIKDRRFRKTNKPILHRKSMQYTQAAGTPHQTDEEDNPEDSPPKSTSPPIDTRPSSEATAPAPQYAAEGVAPPTPTSPTITKTISHHAQPLKTRLAMTSMISYFNDRILSPEMMRAMILLYIGPHNRPDFSTDYLLSPILAPDSLLALFPKTCFMTGERDPLVDDTVIFAGRIRQAKAEARERRYGTNLGSKQQQEEEEEEEDPVEVALIPGISHGFMQFVGVFPEGWKYMYRCGRWIEQLFALAEEQDLRAGAGRDTPGFSTPTHHHRQRSAAQSSGEEDVGLEMSFSPSSSSGSKSKSRNNGHAASNNSENTKAATDLQKRKERLLKQHLEDQRNRRRGVGREEEEREREKGEGKGEGNGKGNGKEKEKGMKKRKSLVSLASESDLLGRRMLGLVGGLTGSGLGEGEG